MADHGDLLARLTETFARTSPDRSLAERLCLAYADLAGATGAAVTMWYGEPHRTTLAATDETAARLEDVQDVVGEGPGHAAWSGGRIETDVVPGSGSDRWQAFLETAGEIVETARVVAVPTRPAETTDGVITLYQVPQPPDADLRLDHEQLQFLANAIGAALIRDAPERDDDLSTGTWASRSPIHQATGMVVAQLHITPEDALALLRAHAYAEQQTRPPGTGSRGRSSGVRRRDGTPTAPHVGLHPPRGRPRGRQRARPVPAGAE